MTKTLVVAESEFTTLTRSRAFVIGIALMPLLMGVAFAAQRFTRNTIDRADHRFVVVDRTGVLFDMVQAVADEWNRRAAADPSSAGPRYLPERAGAVADDDQARAQLSDRVQRGELYAFVEIPADVLQPSSASHIRYYSSHDGDQALPSWVRQTVDAAIIERRFRDAHVDAAVVASLMRPAPMDRLGLVERSRTGGLKRAAGIDPIRTQAVPIAMMMIVLFSVMSTAPQLLNSTIEEKMSRVSEVLIGSVTPFDGMKRLSSASNACVAGAQVFTIAKPIATAR